GENRFSKVPALRILETKWGSPHEQDGSQAVPESDIAEHVRVVVCSNQEAEVTLAAREIMRRVRGGLRFRDISVLVRNFEGYHPLFSRVFSRYGVPFFMDRRESVTHHPLAELTRSALRTVAFGWSREDWFAALKTGLMPISDEEIDQLENE